VAAGAAAGADRGVFRSPGTEDLTTPLLGTNASSYGAASPGTAGGATTAAAVGAARAAMVRACGEVFGHYSLAPARADFNPKTASLQAQVCV
jgi:hypothetical protein